MTTAVKTDKTDKEIITQIFKDLRKEGFVARQNLACCQSCAWSEVDVMEDKKGKTFENVVFYHRQDAESFDTKTKNLQSTLFLAWRGDSSTIVKVIRKNGLKVDWDGSDFTRIGIVVRPENIVDSRW
ncbi:DUF6891 domain-containing protein [Rossellomorea marisflavi]|uniref:DUF6891 domain-containing protein n=1 Tax=Rossellomorea marisflavi TaxID=189381 RepID=UPI003FA0BAE5